MDLNTEGSSDNYDFEDLINLSPSMRSEANELEIVDVQSSHKLLSANPRQNAQEKQVAELEEDIPRSGESRSGSTSTMVLDSVIEGKLDGYQPKHITYLTSEPENHCRADHPNLAFDRLRCTESQAIRNKRSLEVSSTQHTKTKKAPRSLQMSESGKAYEESIVHGMKNRCTVYIESEIRRGGKERKELEGYLLDFSVAICGLGAVRPDILLSLALGLGSCTAMLTLQQVVESIRSKSVAEAVLVSRRRSMQERLAAIRYLDLRTAHFRLARRLHIYHLYLEAESTCDSVESDGFVFVTPWKQKSLDGSTKCGNPRNDRKAQVTNAMIGQGSTYLTRQRTVAQRREYVNRLRRFGARLKKLKDEFTIGVFALLDDALDEKMLVSFETI